MSTRIVNMGDEAASHSITWSSNYISPQQEEEASRVIDLQPGQVHQWFWEWEEVYDYYSGYFTVVLKGDWEDDNVAMGVFNLEKLPV